MGSPCGLPLRSGGAVSAESSGLYVASAKLLSRISAGIAECGWAGLTAKAASCFLHDAFINPPRDVIGLIATPILHGADGRELA